MLNLRLDILQSVFDKLSDALFLYDTSLHIVGANESAERLFGMQPNEMIGKHCQELFRRGDGESEPFWLRSGTIGFHINHGSNRVGVIRIVPLFDESGGLEGMAAIVKDIPKEFAPVQRPVVAESPAMIELFEF